MVYVIDEDAEEHQSQDGPLRDSTSDLTSDLHPATEPLISNNAFQEPLGLLMSSCVVHSAGPETYEEPQKGMPASRT